MASSHNPLIRLQQRSVFPTYNMSFEPIIVGDASYEPTIHQDFYEPYQDLKSQLPPYPLMNPTTDFMFPESPPSHSSGSTSTRSPTPTSVTSLHPPYSETMSDPFAFDALIAMYSTPATQDMPPPTPLGLGLDLGMSAHTPDVPCAEPSGPMSSLSIIPPPTKRTRDSSHSDSSVESITETSTSTRAPKRARTSASRRPGTDPTKTRACARCKKNKMKCTFQVDQSVCERCDRSHRECILVDRKPRGTEKRIENLQLQMKERDLTIETLRRQLSSAGGSHSDVSRSPTSSVSSKVSLRSSTKKRAAVPIKVRRSSRTAKGQDIEGDVESESEDEDCDNEEEEEEEEDVHHYSGQYSSPSAGSQPLSAEHSVSDTSDSCHSGANTTSSKNDANALITRNDPAAPPAIIAHGLVNPEDVHVLFDIFYQRMNPHVRLLDQDTLDPATVLVRSPFLFTVICALASRHMVSERPNIYIAAMQCAKEAAVGCLMDGWKTPEACQAYALLSVWSAPSECPEEDKRWLWAGVAARMAADLGLNRGDRDGNKHRIYDTCYIIDRELTLLKSTSTSLTSGRGSSGIEHFSPSSSVSSSSPLVVVRAALLDLTQAFLVRANALLKSARDFEDAIMSLVQSYAAQMASLRDQVEAEDSETHADQVAKQDTLFAVHYYTLVIHAFALDNTPLGSVSVSKCYEASLAALTLFNGSIREGGLLAYATDTMLAQGTAVTTLLLKLLQPHFAPFIHISTRQHSLDQVYAFISAMQNVSLEVTGSYTAAYASFVEGLKDEMMSQEPSAEPSVLHLDASTLLLRVAFRPTRTGSSSMPPSPRIGSSSPARITAV